MEQENLQQFAPADLLPEINVVKNDPYNSDVADLELMSPEVLEKYKKDETFETENIKIPMIDLPLVLQKTEFVEQSI